LHLKKNPGVFSSRVFGVLDALCSYILSPLDPESPGILFTDVKPRDQANALGIVDFCCVECFVFIIVSIV
jgi:hypothetical protein